MSRIRNTGKRLLSQVLTSENREIINTVNWPSFFKGAEQADGRRPGVDGHHWGLRRVPHREGGEELFRRKPRVQPNYTILQVVLFQSAFGCQFVCYKSQCAKANPSSLAGGDFIMWIIFWDVACCSFVQKNVNEPRQVTLFPDVTDMLKVTLMIFVSNSCLDLVGLNCAGAVLRIWNVCPRSRTPFYIPDPGFRILKLSHHL